MIIDPNEGDDAVSSGFQYALSEENDMQAAQLIAGKLDWIRLELVAMQEALTGIRVTMEAQQQMSEELIEEAREQDEIPSQPIEPLPPPDYYPFLGLPSGTLVRELPSSGRLFILPDGLILRSAAKNEIVAVDENGELAVCEPGPGASVTVAPNRAFPLAPDFLQLTHEAAGIAGLPLDVQPQIVAPGRVSVQLACGTRLEIHQRDRMLSIINPSGTIGILSDSRIEAIGEEVQTRLIPNGPRAFSFLESGHAGVIEPDGTIRLSTDCGLDLVISFPEREPDNPPQPDTSICATCGIKHC